MKMEGPIVEEIAGVCVCLCGLHLQVLSVCV